MPAKTPVQFSRLAFYTVLFLMPILGGGNFPWLDDGRGASLVWNILALLLWAGVMLSRPVGVRDLLRHKPLRPFWIFGLWLLIALSFTRVPGLSLELTLQWLSIGLFLFTALALRFNQKEIRTSLAVYLAGAAVVALYAVYQVVWGFESLGQTPGLSAEDMALLRVVQRPFGFFPGANILGGFMAALFPLVALLFLNLRKLWVRGLLAVAMVLFLVALLFTYSRGAWLVFLFGLVPTVILLSGRRGLVAKLVVVVAFLAALFLFFNLRDMVNPEHGLFQQSLTERMASITSASDVSGQARMEYWASAWHMGLDSLPFGGGFGTFQELCRKYFSASTYTKNPHNILLQFFAELGPLGFLIALAMLFVIVQVVRRPHPDELPGSRGLLATAAGLMFLHGLMDIDFSSPAIVGGFGMFVVFLFTPGLPGIERPGKNSDALLRSLCAIFVFLLLILGQFLPFMARKYNELADAAATASQNDKALDLAETAIAYWPLDAGAQYRASRYALTLFRMNMQRERLNKALERNQRAVELNPGNPEFKLGLADILLAMGRKAETKAAVKDAADSYPASVYYQTEYARILALLGETAASLYTLNQALAMEESYLKHRNPNGIDLIEARFLRAEVLRKADRMNEARQEYENLRALCRRDGLVLKTYTSTRSADITCADIEREIADQLVSMDKEAQKAADEKAKETGAEPAAPAAPQAPTP